MEKGIDDDERPKLRPFPERREGLVRAENRPSSQEVFNSAQAEALQLVEGAVRGEDPVYASARDELVATVKRRTGQSLTFRVSDRITNSLVLVLYQKRSGLQHSPHLNHLSAGAFPIQN
jgi:hypothetical protein